MPPKMGMTKEKKAMAASAGGKKAKKKWSKGKTRESLENAVLWEPAMIEKLNNEVPKYKVITPSVVSDRLKISVALAAEGLKHLAKKGTIRLVSNSGKFVIYSRAIAAPVTAPAATEKAAEKPAAKPAAEKPAKK